MAVVHPASMSCESPQNRFAIFVRVHKNDDEYRTVSVEVCSRTTLREVKFLASRALGDRSIQRFAACCEGLPVPSDDTSVGACGVGREGAVLTLKRWFSPFESEVASLLERNFSVQPL